MATKPKASAAAGVTPPATPSAAAQVLPPGGNVIRLGELVALIHHETQQVIELLAMPEFHQISQQTPSASLVKIENLQIELPLRVLPQTVNANPQEVAAAPALSRAFITSGGASWVMHVSVPATSNQSTTQVEGRLRIEFSVAAK
jgi:hypothetical protein